MGAKRYEELVCWQLSNELKLKIYAFIDRPPVAKDVSYCDQIRESARSAPRNIAEAFGASIPPILHDFWKSHVARSLKPTITFETVSIGGT